MNAIRFSNSWNFLATINNVVNQPGSIPDREFVINEAEKFAAEISSLRLRLNDLREVQSVNVENLVTEANQLIDKIIDLNPKISKLEASGLLQSDAGALRTQRYDALNRLSELIPIRYHERSDGAIDVFTGSDYLVMAGTSQKLELQTNTDRGVVVHDVLLSQTRSNISHTGGELKGIVEGRDEILGGFVDQLDTYASQLIFEFNKIHASGEGTAGFGQITSASRALDSSATLNSEQSGLPFQAKHGSFQIKVTNKSTGITETVTINVDLDGIGTDTTLDSLASSINGVANLNSSVSTDGRLSISANADYEFKFSAAPWQPSASTLCLPALIPAISVSIPSSSRISSFWRQVRGEALRTAVMPCCWRLSLKNPLSRWGASASTVITKKSWPISRSLLPQKRHSRREHRRSAIP